MYCDWDTYAYTTTCSRNNVAFVPTNIYMPSCILQAAVQPTWAGGGAHPWHRRHAPRLQRAGLRGPVGQPRPQRLPVLAHGVLAAGAGQVRLRATPIVRRPPSCKIHTVYVWRSLPGEAGYARIRFRSIEPDKTPGPIEVGRLQIDRIYMCSMPYVHVCSCPHALALCSLTASIAVV